MALCQKPEIQLRCFFMETGNRFLRKIENNVMTLWINISVSDREIIDMAIIEMNQLLACIEETNKAIDEKRKDGENYDKQIQRLVSIKEKV